MKRKIASIILALCMAAELAGPAQVQIQAAQVQEDLKRAADNDLKANVQGAFTYQIRADETVELTRYTGSDEVLVIPSQMDGRQISCLGDSLFSECNRLKSVKIPDGVTSLLDYTFANCTNLEQVTFPDSVAYIGEHAFMGCKSLKTIKLPDNVKDIAWDTFGGCTALTNVQLPKKLETISMKAFSGCKGLQNITLPEGTRQIGEAAFFAAGLQSIRLPKSLREVAPNAFAKCSELKDVDYAGSKAERKKIRITGTGNEILLGARIHYNDFDKSEVLAPKNGTVIQSGKDSYKVLSKTSTVAFYQTSRKGRALTVPESVVIDGILYDVAAVNAKAFLNNKKVSKITVKGEIRTIGSNAFKGCSGLKTLVIKSRQLKSVGADALKGTPSNIKVKVPLGEATHYKNMLKDKGIGKKAAMVEY